MVLICGKYKTLTLEFKINIAICVPLYNEQKSERKFQDYLHNLGLEDTNFFALSEPELDHYLTTFWFNVHTKNGKHYCSTSLETIRYGLNRSLKRFGHAFDITKRECTGVGCTHNLCTRFPSCTWHVQSFLSSKMDKAAGL